MKGSGDAGVRAASDWERARTGPPSTTGDTHTPGGRLDSAVKLKCMFLVRLREEQIGFHGNQVVVMSVRMFLKSKISF